RPRASAGTAKDVTPPSDVPHGRPDVSIGLHKALPNTQFVKLPRGRYAASSAQGDPTSFTRSVAPCPPWQAIQRNRFEPVRQPPGSTSFSNFRRTQAAAKSMTLNHLAHIVKG
ncbi:MAG: hypothetical protein M3P24_10650, partial [Gemmatimonadota bacterium]|nr:hypothetical protein [Gemmatimonadota bacterium]